MADGPGTKAWLNEPRPHEVAGPIDFVPTLPNATARATQKFGEDLFLIEGDRKLSFAEVDRQSAKLARGLLAMGLGKGSRVGIMFPNCADWVIIWFAIARIGALAVTLSTLFQRREIAWALKHNDIDTLLVIDRYGSSDYQARLEEAVPGLAAQSATKPFFLASAPYLRRVAVWGQDVRPWAMKGPDAITALATAQIDDAFLREVEATITPADDLVVICTSGTTAEPKAVVATHGAGLRNTWNFTPYTQFGRGDRTYCGLPYFWVGGFLRGIMPALFAGSAMVYPKSLSGDDLLDMLIDDEVTVIFTGVAQLHAIRQAMAKRGIAELPQIHDGLVYGIDRVNGGVVPPDQRVGGSLGMTETFGTHSTDALDRPAHPGKAKNWGRPQPGVERRIVSLETGALLAPGEEGELQLRGSTLMRGYYKREREDVFTPDGWFRTGDRCIIDEDDFLFFFGRANELIKTSGANVSPPEVEAALVSYPEVREAIVFGVPDPAKGDIVAAVVVPEDGFAIDNSALRQKVRGEISSYKVPTIIMQMAYDEVPRTDAAGKPKKVVLRQMIVDARKKSPSFGQ